MQKTSMMFSGVSNFLYGTSVKNFVGIVPPEFLIVFCQLIVPRNI